MTHDPWDDLYADVPGSVRRVLGLYGIVDQETVAHALATALHLRIDRATESTWRALYALVEPLGRALDLGPYAFDERPGVVVREAMQRIDRCVAAQTLEDLGWKDARLKAHEPRICDLADLLRVQLAQRLVIPLARAMSLWSKKGLVAPEAKRPNRPSAA